MCFQYQSNIVVRLKLGASNLNLGDFYRGPKDSGTNEAAYQGDTWEQ